MEIESSRFGTIEIRDDAIITFPDGLIGLPGKRYALIAQSETSPFYWLQSVDDPELAVPVTTPWLFFSDYVAHVSDEDARQLQLDGPEEANIFCVVRAAEQPEDFTVNLLAPVIVHAAKRLGRQVINEASGYRVREPLFGEVELCNVEATSPGIPVAAWAV